MHLSLSESWVHSGVLVQDVPAGLCTQRCIPLHHIWRHPAPTTWFQTLHRKMQKRQSTRTLLMGDAQCASQLDNFTQEQSSQNQPDNDSLRQSCVSTTETHFAAVIGRVLKSAESNCEVSDN